MLIQLFGSNVLEAGVVEYSTYGADPDAISSLAGRSLRMPAVNTIFFFNKEKTFIDQIGLQ